MKIRIKSKNHIIQLIWFFLCTIFFIKQSQFIKKLIHKGQHIRYNKACVLLYQKVEQSQHIRYNKACVLLYQKVEQSQHFNYISNRDIIKS
jgi:hypothetical protein